MQSSADNQPIGVVLGQLGTPEAPTAGALRPYLRQFLSDMRVIDYSPFIWQPLLRGIILRVRPRKSAKLYERIWTDEGSPLLVYTQRQANELQKRLGDGFKVTIGMTYGEPSIGGAIRQLEAEGINRIIVVPMYPQYSSTTTASVYDAAYTGAAGRRCPLFNERKRSIPTLRFVPAYYDDEGYINAMTNRVQTAIETWERRPDRILFSFHGIPKRYAETGDPYPQQCEITAKLLAERLNLEPDQWLMTYQSQFGPEKWLGPATDEMIEKSAHEGIQNLLVFSPGFVSDCLETIDELGNEGLEQWEEAGGDPEGFRLVPCLNDASDWIDSLATIVKAEASGWVRLYADSISEPVGD